jgi:hypothetical protein
MISNAPFDRKETGSPLSLPGNARGLYTSNKRSMHPGAKQRRAITKGCLRSLSQVPERQPFFCALMPFYMVSVLSSSSVSSLAKGLPDQAASARASSALRPYRPAPQPHRGTSGTGASAAQLRVST